MKDKWNQLLQQVYGKTIGIVYNFEGEEAEGYQHYDVWQSDVIMDWLEAIQNIKCRPFILDTRTFVSKAMNNTLPRLDYVVNLNNGTNDISSLGLIPSVCSFLSVPCIPGNTDTILVGENKKISNYIAEAIGISLPKHIPANSTNAIIRPLNLGSSCGIVRGGPDLNLPSEYLSQEFIPGFDMTTPLLYNPIQGKLEVLPSIMYYPENRDINWFLGEKEKNLHRGYEKIVVRCEYECREALLHMAKAIGVVTYCRIDARIRCTSPEEFDAALSKPVRSENLYFLEINPIPTIKKNINFHTSIEHLQPEDTFGEVYSDFKNVLMSNTPTSFILVCSILAFKARR